MAYAVPVVALSTVNIDITNPTTAFFDGFEVPSGGGQAGRRVLLTAQDDKSENGVQIFAGTGNAMGRPTASGDQYLADNILDNATLIPVVNGTQYAGTVWGIDPAMVVTVDTTPHTLTRVSLPPVQCRVATTANVDLGTTILMIDPTIVNDAMMQTGAATTLTCPRSKPFASDDVGKPIVVAGAGAAGDLVTSIAGYTSASVVTLASGCSTSVSTRVTDGVMSTGGGSKTLTSASAPFVLGDVGKTVFVAGAGEGGSDLVTKIAGYTSSTVVALANGCTTSVAAAVVQFGTTTAQFSVQLRGDGEAGSDIVLVKNQTTRSQNGFYWAKTTGTMERCTEPLVPNRVALVSEGARNAHTRYELTNQGPIVRGTTGLNFSPQNLSYNVRDFGALGDSTTNDLPAFYAAMNAMSADESAGAVLEVPTGDYFLDGDLHISRQVVLRGWSVGGGLSALGSSILRFSAGHGLFVDRFNTGPAGGAGDFTIIECLDLVSTPLTLAARPLSTAVTAGSLVHGVDDNRYYFECTTAGTTSSSPNPFATTPNLAIGSDIQDNDVHWTVRAHAGITLKARAYVRKVFVYQFTNAGVLIATPYGDESPSANANGWQLAHMGISDCGMGVCVYGPDANAGTALDVEVQHAGDHIAGTGGHAFHDRSGTGGTYVGCQVDTCTGRSFLVDTGGGDLNFSSFVGCYSENSNLPPKVAASAAIFGGVVGSVCDPDSAGLVLVPGFARNIHFADAAQGTIGGLDQAGAPRVMWFQHEDDWVPFSYEYGAGLAGEWAFNYGGRPLQSFLGEEAAGVKGNWRDVHGHYLGINDSEHVFIGPASARTDKYVRGGRFLVGDQFWLQGSGRAGTYQGWTVREPGYRGLPWAASTTYGADAPAGVADMVEPTSHDPDEPLANGNVFRCIQDGISHATTEPTWASAPNVNDEIADGTTRWVNVGTVALYNRIGVIHEEGKLTTTDATASKVLANYPLPDETLTYVEVTVIARRTDAADGASFLLTGSWYRYGAGAPVAVRAATQDQKDGNAAWDAVLALNGNAVEVQVTGQTAKTIHWTAIRKGSEGN